MSLYKPHGLKTNFTIDIKISNNILILWKLMKLLFVLRTQISKVVLYLIVLFFPCE